MFRHRQSFGTPVGYVDANSWLFPTTTEVMNAGLLGSKNLIYNNGNAPLLQLGVENWGCIANVPM